MAIINFARSEIEVKIVYYGPAFSGKTTNVEILYRLVPATQRGELHSLRTEQDRTLFFDYVPVQLGEIGGFKARFKLFTVPGQVYYKDTRRVVLQGADAVVFVADSTPDRQQANLDSLVDLEENLKEHGFDLSSMPLVIQLNKRDVPGALDPDTMAADLNPFGVPVVEASAKDGRGVLDTLRRITEIAADRIHDNLAGNETAVPLTGMERAEAESEGEVVKEHLDRIKKVRPGEQAHVDALRAAGKISHADVNAFLSEVVERRDPITEESEAPPPTVPLPVTAGPSPAGAEVAMDGPEAWGGAPVSKPPPPPPPAPVVAAAPAAAPPPPLPVGPPMEAWITGAPIAVREIRNTVVGPDGRIHVDVVLGAGAQAQVRTISVATKPPVREPPRWVTGIGAAMIGGGIGVLVGIAVGWLAFA
ncbi:MAG: GTP-binding protein [Myxococcota bacterium]